MFHRINFSKVFLIFTIIICFGNLNIFAQNNDVNSILELNQNPAFGFSPSIKLEYPLTNDIVLVPYAEFWFQNAYKDTAIYIYPGTEFGIGARFSFMGDKMNLLTSLGIYNGNSFSGGRNFLLMDAFVPKIEFDFKATNEINLSLFTRAWIQSRKVNTYRATFDDMEIIAKVDYSMNKHFSLGLFFNQLIVNQKYNNNNVFYTTFFVFGPSVTLNTKSVSLFIGLGADLSDYMDSGVQSADKTIKEYYRVNAKIKL